MGWKKLHASVFQPEYVSQTKQFQYYARIPSCFASVNIGLISNCVFNVQHPAPRHFYDSAGPWLILTNLHLLPLLWRIFLLKCRCFWISHTDILQPWENIWSELRSVAPMTVLAPPHIMLNRRDSFLFQGSLQCPSHQQREQSPCSSWQRWENCGGNLAKVYDKLLHNDRTKLRWVNKVQSHSFSLGFLIACKHI